MAQILSVNIGRVTLRASSRGAEKPTGIGKQPAVGPVRIGRLGLDGDESAYRARDQGDTAVHIFCAESYAAFSAQAGRPIPIPSFGENLTVQGYTEQEARVGDVVRVGTGLLRVNQPVVRCSWPTVQSGEPRLTRWATKALTTGFYLDVVEEGVVQAGDRLEIVSRGPEGWTIAALNAILHAKPPDSAAAAAALALAELAERWKADLRETLASAT
ncbi:MAG: hypothetical protein RLY86_2126 [Pseudomonadota bacterium]|jgi:MOSC domain-containing protein YiiM